VPDPHATPPPRARRAVRTSAGLLLFRRAVAGPLEVLIVHPGGPYWARRDTGWWSLPKGEVDVDEAPLAAAIREFEEELGVPAPRGTAVPIGEVVQRGGKRVLAWAVEGDVDADGRKGGTFEMEWPPRSGIRRTFPEVDRAAWCTVEEARERLIAAQRPFLDRLERLVDRSDPSGTAGGGGFGDEPPVGPPDDLGGGTRAL
jgi:predicted NUDIX family NTP pyrophosphohydrolase